MEGRLGASRTRVRERGLVNGISLRQEILAGPPLILTVDYSKY